MITTIAELLQQLIEREAEVLAEQPIVHRPTIGNMYEGLTRDVLLRAIPPSLGLQLLDGFVEGHDGALSQQVDAMLVMGNAGRQIPKTSQYIWPIRDVLAVFEIKKVLYGADLADALTKMKVISDLQLAALNARAIPDVSLGASARAFARVFGRHPRPDELSDFVGEGGEVFRTIAAEQLAPVRVIYGYEGYVDEYGLREGLMAYLESRIGQAIGPATLPSLIVCRGNSIIKTAGHPYTVPVATDGWFALFGSERRQPWRLLIELIWTRLANQFAQVFPMDDTLDNEAIARLLEGKPVEEDGRRGWMYKIIPIARADLNQIASEKWSPVELTLNEEVVLKVALATGGLDLNDRDLRAFATKEGFGPREVAQSLVDNRLFAWTGEDTAEPIADTIHMATTPDRRTWASLNGELLMLWVEAQIDVAAVGESDPS